MCMSWLAVRLTSLCYADSFNCLLPISDDRFPCESHRGLATLIYDIINDIHIRGERERGKPGCVSVSMCVSMCVCEG